MRPQRAALVGLAAAAVGIVAGCLDALAPPRAPRVATVALAPMFGVSGAASDIPPDVDSVVIRVVIPPSTDTITVSRRIEPGQDSIVITIDVPIANATTVDAVMGMEALRTGPPAEVLYRAAGVPLSVRVGQPTRVDTMRAEYVGPGAGILQAITITPRAIVLRPGDSLAFTFSAIDSTGATCCATMPLLWNSRTPAIASVSARGVATGRGSGSAWIVATAGASAAIKDSVEIVVATSPVALIAFGPSTATFTARAGQADPAPQVVTVTNGGAGTLSNITLTGILYATGQPTGWLAATLEGPSAPTTLTLAATTGALAPGTYTATVSLTSSQASNSPIALPVTFVVNPVPAIGLTPARDSVVDTLTTADPSPRTVTVANTGTGTVSGLSLGAISYATGQPTGWLTATISGATAPATITLTYAKGTLPEGRYTATVPVTSTSAVNSPQTLTAIFDVQPLAQIGLAPTSLSFVDTVTTSDPPAVAVAVTNAGTGTLSGIAVDPVTYGTGQPTGWLTASLSGTTAPATLTVSVAKGSLAPGIYSATIPVSSAAAANSPQSVGVSFTLGPMPLIDLASTRDSVVDTLTTSDPAPRTVAVANTGTGTLSGLALGSVAYGAGQPTGWLTATLDRTTAPATLTLTYAKGSLPVGSYTATIPVTSAAAGNSPQTLTAVFDVRPGPVIGFTPTSVTFTDTVLTGDPAAQTVTITNDAGGTLAGLALGAVTYGAGEPTGWLTASIAGATLPSTITISVAKGTLAPGTYTASVPVAAPVASNSPRALSVVFTVAPTPTAILPFSATVPASVANVVLTFTGPATDTPLVFSFPVTAAGTPGGTIVVPATWPLLLHAEAFDSAGVKTHAADTTITLVPGTNPALSLELNALDGNVTWRFGTYAIVLDQTDTTLSVGETLRYAATIIDPYGRVVAGAVPAWASTNPSVVSVDASGLAQALVPGSARIVATYRGVAASRAVVVR